MNTRSFPRFTILAVLAVVVLLTSSCQTPLQNAPDDMVPGWYKGNLHTHSFWSDGDDFPESIVAWYVDRGYDFVAISDHNTMAESERWLRFDSTSARYQAYQLYQERFGDAWVEAEEVGDSVFVRLKTFDEYAGRFTVDGEFMVIHSEEITDGYDGKPIHINATNIKDYIEPQGGTSVLDVMQRNVTAVLQQREATGQAMFPHINHPNFGWAVTAEDLARLEGERFIEVYNGHPSVNNNGDAERPSVEMMWDIANTIRIAEGRPLLLGLAVDDAHNFHEMAMNRSNPGRGWVMVQAPSLSAEDLIHSMEEGSFYASSGVELVQVTADENGIEIEISTEEGVTYTTEYYGTRGPGEVGVLLATIDGPTPAYTFSGDELFVRARVISSVVKENPYSPGEFERAWTQPVIPTILSE